MTKKCSKCGIEADISLFKIRSAWCRECRRADGRRYKRSKYMPHPRPPAEQRVWQYIDITPGFGRDGDCWRWSGDVRKGYGQFHYGCRTVPASHYIFGLYYGPIPHGLKILHSCDNPPCVNPEHLSVGDMSDNMRDCVNKGRHNPQRGSKNSMAKLTEADIPIIRESRDTDSNLSKKFNVSRRAIRFIRIRETWKHV